jgi:uncharacterized membrane protein YbhN (UPF0104 family)
VSDDAASAPAVDDLAAPPEVESSRLRRQLIWLATIVVVAVVLITVVPGFASLRSRFAHADPAWIGLGAALKVLSGASYVAAFRGVFCRGMRWRTSAQIGFAELGANAVVPTGGFGGLALGAWTLHRGGMDSGHIARRSVAFFFLTSLPNVLGVVIIGLGLAVGVFDGKASLALSIVPAAVAASAIVLTIAGARWAGAAAERRAAHAGERSRLARALGALADGVEEGLALLRARDPWLYVGLAGYLAFDVMIVWATFHAFGSVPPLAIVWIAYLIGELGGLIPVPGGIGGVDLGLVGTYVLYHVSLTSATAAVLAYRALALLVPALLGAIAFTLLRRSLAREALALSSCAPGQEVEVIGRGRITPKPLPVYSLEDLAHARRSAGGG